MIDAALGELWTEEELSQAARMGSVHALGSPQGRDLATAIRDLTRDAWLTGWHAGGSQLEARIQKAVSVPEPGPARSVSVTDTTMDWDSWTPGDLHAASFAADPGLARLLQQQDATIQGIIGTTMSDLSNRIEAGLKAGDSVETISRSLRDLVNGNASRAEMIAHTETARVTTYATQDRYRTAGVDRWEWVLSDGACPLCEEKSKQGPFTLDQQGPPAHPRCRCAIIPSEEALATLPADFEGQVAAETATYPAVAAETASVAPEDAVDAFLSNPNAIDHQLRGMVPLTSNAESVAKALDQALKDTDPSVFSEYGCHFVYTGDPAVRDRILSAAREGGEWEDPGFLIGSKKTAVELGVDQESIDVALTIPRGTRFIKGPDGELILPRGSKLTFSKSEDEHLLHARLEVPDGYTGEPPALAAPAKKVPAAKTPKPAKAPVEEKPKQELPTERRTFEPVEGDVQDFGKSVPSNILQWGIGDQQRHDIGVTSAVSDWVKTHLKQKLGWSAEEREAFKIYKGSGYKVINPFLRGTPWKNSYYTTERLQALADRMREAMSRTSVRESFVVYRGVTDMGLMAGDVFIDEGFVSTTFSPYVIESSVNFARGDTGQILRIKVPKGAQGTSLITFGKYKEEKEFLLDAGTEFRVIGSSGKYLDVEIVSQRQVVDEVATKAPKVTEAKPEKPTEKPAEKPTEKPAEEPSKPVIDAQGRERFDRVTGSVTDFAYKGRNPNLLNSQERQIEDERLTSRIKDWLSTTTGQDWTEAASKAFFNYSGLGHLSINGLLRKTRKVTAAEANHLRKQIADMREAMTTVGEPVAVYRGVTDMNLQVGDSWIDNGFTSATLNPQVVESFVMGEDNAQELRIVVPKGARGASLVGFGVNKEEKEFLLDAGTEFRVVGRTRKYLDVEVVSQDAGAAAKAPVGGVKRKAVSS